MPSPHYGEYPSFATDAAATISIAVIVTAAAGTALTDTAKRKQVSKNDSACTTVPAESAADVLAIAAAAR